MMKGAYLTLWDLNVITVRCCITDTLVRAGAAVTLASVEAGQLTVTCSRGVKIVADKPIETCEGQVWDLVVCPGGMPGAERLRDSAALTRILTAQRSSGRWLAAICAAPAVVLHHHGLLGDAATCYPAPKFRDQLGGKLVAWEAPNPNPSPAASRTANKRAQVAR
jgi:4-methyl-5(b-hydroxyethyl)-thiazole monophosphate biosynthesis